MISSFERGLHLIKLTRHVILLYIVIPTKKNVQLISRSRNVTLMPTSMGRTKLISLHALISTFLKTYFSSAENLIS